jgi:hypothetical protein
MPIRIVRDTTEEFRMTADSSAGIFTDGTHYWLAWGDGYDILSAGDRPTDPQARPENTAEHGIQDCANLAEAERQAAIVREMHESTD